ncbi:hypothetical protein BRD17_09635 [Halobacteriales archaeon SW_7_68_16]|nr:MAG: hypothetical protein BRD17_09635 [Halobacteriales archaeon SW_7_68_16]
MTDAHDVLDRVGEAVFALDAGWRFTCCNEAAADLLDRDRDDLLGAVMWDEFPQLARSRLPDVLHETVADGTARSFTMAAGDDRYAIDAHPDDGGVTVLLEERDPGAAGETASEPVGDGATPDASNGGGDRGERHPGAATGAEEWLDATTDATAVDVLPAALLDRVSDAFVALDDEWRFRYLNGSAEALLARDREELLGRVIWDEFPETVETQFPEGFYEAMATGDPVAFDVYHPPLGTHFEARAYPGPDGLSVSLREVTDRKEREREVERYERTVEAAGDPIYTLDADGYITDVNRATVEFSGYDRDELVGEHVSALIDEEELTAAEDQLRDALAEGTVGTVEFDVETRIGEVRRCEATIAPIPGESGFDGTVTVLRDLTELRQREQRLTVLDRVLRHNLRNHMNVVMGHAERLRSGVDDDTLVASAEKVVEVAERIMSLSDDARRFEDALKPDAGELAARPIEDIEWGATEVAKQYPSADVTVEAPDDGLVLAHDSVTLAVQELVENAIVHNEGTTHVDVTIEREGDPGDGEVRIRVADDGPSLPGTEREVLEHGSESPLEHASGLGLWLVNWSVTKSGGTLTFKERDPGSAVTIHLHWPADESDGRVRGESTDEPTGEDAGDDGRSVTHVGDDAGRGRRP